LTNVWGRQWKRFLNTSLYMQVYIMYYVGICLFYKIMFRYHTVSCIIPERNNVSKNDTGLCFWAIFQAVGLTCIGMIVCRSVVYQHGFFEISPNRNSTSITRTQFCNWHYSLTTIGFIYLYANCKCCHGDSSAVYIPTIITWVLLQR